MLLGTFGATLLGDLLKSKEVKAKIPERGIVRAWDGTIRAGQDF